MDNNFEYVVYSKNVLEFLTVAGEYCNFIEKAKETEKRDFLNIAQKILPLLYLKGSLLPEVKNEFDEMVEKFVTEETWNHYEIIVRTKLGDDNDYLEVFDPDIGLTDGPVAASLSENFVDIYQDMKDFITAYRIGSVEIMNDALWECKQNFEQYWGQKLLNALRAIHLNLFGKLRNDQDETIPKKDRLELNKEKDNWMFNKMQQQYREDHNED